MTYDPQIHQPRRLLVQGKRGAGRPKLVGPPKPRRPQRYSDRAEYQRDYQRQRRKKNKMADFKNINDLIQFKDTEERFNRVLWFEALKESIEDGKLEDAIKAINAAIRLERRENLST